MILAFETSCDETAASIFGGGKILSSAISSQIEEHRPFGGVVPEVASRSHIEALGAITDLALKEANVELSNIEAFAATSGPGLASSLVIGNTFAKTLSLSEGKPFISINHLEGHLLSPFLSTNQTPKPSMGLIASGGHSLLIKMDQVGDYTHIGSTRDDAAGEAYDKVAKMIGLPYPGGPGIDLLAKNGDPTRFDFPRSMMERDNHDFSFSGLKTSVFYLLPKLDINDRDEWLEDICASFQEAVVDVLVTKTIRATKEFDLNTITVSGGVSCNSRLREVFTEKCEAEGIELLLSSPEYSTDNAAMIAYAGQLKFEQQITTDLSEDINPNLPIT